MPVSTSSAAAVPEAGSSGETVNANRVTFHTGNTDVAVISDDGQYGDASAVELTNGMPEHQFTNRLLQTLRQCSEGSVSSDHEHEDGNVYVHQAKMMDVDKPVTRRLDEVYPKTSVSFHRNLKDLNCDPDYPKVLQFQDVSLAAFRIRGGIEKTPCTKSRQLSRMYGMEIYCKKDFLQATGSFKERGARNLLMKLTPGQKKLGVVAASAGNHALALSYHGHELGIPVTVVMPVLAPLMKVSLCRSYDANVIVHGAHVGEAKEFAMIKADEEGLLYVNGYDHIDILAGAGTIGLEILDEVPNVDAVIGSILKLRDTFSHDGPIVPVGGGGLIAGIGCAIKNLKPEITIIGVEAENCPAMSKSLEIGKLTYVQPKSTLADGLSVPIVGVNAFETTKLYVDKMVTVSEKEIARAILRLIEIEKAVVEGAGAVGLAAILSEKLPELKNKRVVIPIVGGNIDTTVLGRTIERGLACDGRLIRFSVTVSDRPGGLAEMTAILAQAGASVKDIFHERAWMKFDVYVCRVKVVIETRDFDHALDVGEILKSHYTDVHFSLEGDD